MNCSKPNRDEISSLFTKMDFFVDGKSNLLSEEDVEKLPKDKNSSPFCHGMRVFFAQKKIKIPKKMR